MTDNSLMNRYLHIPEPPMPGALVDACVHCGYHHNSSTSSCAIPTANFYAIAVDPSFSYDTPCTNMTLVPCDTVEQMMDVVGFMKARADLKLVKGLAQHAFIRRLNSTVRIDDKPVIYNVLPSWADAKPPRWPADAIRLYFTWPEVYSEDDGGSFTHCHLMEFGPDEKPEYDAGGYGYDKKSAVMSRWMDDNMQKELRKLHKRAWSRELSAKGTNRGWVDLWNPDGSLDYHELQHKKHRMDLLDMRANYTGTVEKPRLKSVTVSDSGFSSLQRMLEKLGYTFECIAADNDKHTPSETWALYKKEVPADV